MEVTPFTNNFAPDYAIFPLGDQAVTFSLGDTIHIHHHQKVMAMLHWLRQHPFPGLLDISVAYSSITVAYDFCLLDTNRKTESGFGYVRDMLLDAYRQSVHPDGPARRLIQVPVCYEEAFSPDMEYVMAETKLNRDRIMALHTGRNYQVYMIGFLPGFPYMAEVDPQLTLPRKATPRARVAAGSVGVAGVQTGIYPIPSPGGWQIIGRTPMQLFNPEANPPVVMAPGDQVQFHSITSAQFLEMNEHSA